MFNKEEKNEMKEVETVIGPSVKVRGEFNGNGNIIVEGDFEGTLKTTNGLFVRDRAKVTANIDAKEAVIGGEVNGNIKVQGYIEITSTAKVTGDIECSSIAIAKGAILNGKCTMTNKSSEKVVK